jgi:hypothetical protein
MSSSASASALVTVSIVAGSPTRQSRLTVPSSSVVVANGSVCVAGASAFHARPRGSEYRLKIGERFAFVARVRRRRSSFGPGCVRSCGRMRPGP